MSTIFTRNDKPTDTSSASKPVANEAPVASEPRKVQPAPQPAAYPASTGSPSVSVISKALKITGQLESSEDIQIEGEVDGDVRAAVVKVGSNARVKGTVSGEEVQVAGTVDGKIEARKVTLTSTAHMSGDVIHQDIRIESGAFIDGHCRPEYGKSDSRPSAHKSGAPEKPNGASARASSPV